MENQISIRDRWLGAVCYLSFFVFLPILSSGKSDFLASPMNPDIIIEKPMMVSLILVWVIQATIGQIPLLGFLIVILLWLVFFGVFLSLTVLGFVRAMFGESWRIPYLDELSDRVPIH